MGVGEDLQRLRSTVLKRLFNGLFVFIQFLVEGTGLP